jgi:hypothetical protein
VTVHADKIKAVLPAFIELRAVGDNAQMTTLPGSSPLRVDVGQLAGRLSNRIDWYGNLKLDWHFIVLDKCLCALLLSTGSVMAPPSEHRRRGW